MSQQLPPVAPEIAQMVPYKPGKPIEELERELGIKGAVKLASNENPLGPSPRAMAAVAGCVAGLHRYPDGAGFNLRSALAAHWGLDMGNICLANGSNEVIEMLCKGFLRPGDNAVASQFPFEMYDKLVTVAGCELRRAPLTPDFRVDLDGLLGLVDQRTRLIFVNTPHNPAGTALTKEALRGFLDRVPAGVMVALDEAYIEFADDPQVAQGVEFLTHATPVVVMRTFSKAHGLAGLRIGYALAPKEVVDVFHRVRQPFNTSIPAQVGALAALSDQKHLQHTLEITCQGRKEFMGAFTRWGLWFAPSQANFVLVHLGPHARAVHDTLLRRGLIVRHLGSYGLDEYLRISVGLPEENQLLLRQLENLVGAED